MSSKRVQRTTFLVGGAALSLYYFDRDSTKDIDAGLPSGPRILEVGREALSSAFTSLFHSQNSLDLPEIPTTWKISIADFLESNCGLQRRDHKFD